LAKPRILKNKIDILIIAMGMLKTDNLLAVSGYPFTGY